jgi:dTDP-4-amino-4,6-dideoxygalactose transaminase
MFYLTFSSLEERSKLIAYLRSHHINAVFHYQSLHKSSFYQKKYKGSSLPSADNYTNQLVRLPMYFELSDEEIKRTNKIILGFYQSANPTI